MSEVGGIVGSRPDDVIKLCLHLQTMRMKERNFFSFPDLEEVENRVFVARLGNGGDIEDVICIYLWRAAYLKTRRYTQWRSRRSHFACVLVVHERGRLGRFAR